MRSRFVWARCLVVLGSTCVLGAAPARAQEGAPAPALESAPGVEVASTVERARRSGHEALDAFRSGEFERAHRLFGVAEGLMHSPVFLLYRARSSAQLGHYAEARRDYASVALERLESNAPAAWHEAQRDASHEMTQLERHVVLVRVLVRGEFTPPLELRSDDFEHRFDERLVAFEMDASSLAVLRAFVLEDASGRSSSFIALPESRSARPDSSGPQTATFVFEFWERAPAAASPSVAPATSWVTPAPRLETSENNWPVWTAFGLGAAGLVVAGVTGTLAVVQASEVKAGCLGLSCRPEDRELALEAERFGRVATVGAVVAITGAAVGLSLVLWNANQNEVTARVTPSSVVLNGRF